MQKVIVVQPILNNPKPVEKHELLAHLKIALKDDGFNKTSTNRWQREKASFIEVVYIQSDRYVKGEYIIFLGIILKDTDISYFSEGHFTSSIPNYNTTKEEIVLRIKDFFSTWSDKTKLVQYVKRRKEAWQNLSQYSGEELKLKKREFYSTYRIAVANTDIIDYILSKDF